MGFSVAAAAGRRDEVRRIRLSPPLPCGIGQCGRLTTWALIEDDLERPALWSLLPICEQCAQSLAGRHAGRGEFSLRSGAPVELDQ